MPDEELSQAIADVRAGDAERYRVIVDRCQDGVRRFLAARCRSIPDIEELVQATFVTAYRSLDRWSGAGPFQGWLLGIARNHLRHHQRAWRRDRSTGVQAIDALAAPDAEAEADDEGAILRLRACLERLPEANRSLLQRRYGDGLPLARLAQELATSAEALAARLLRLRQILRRCVEARP